MEGMAGIGVKHISIATRVVSGHVEIDFQARNGWIRLRSTSAGSISTTERSGGSAAAWNSQHEGNAEFIIRLPALESV